MHVLLRSRATWLTRSMIPESRAEGRRTQRQPKGWLHLQARRATSIRRDRGLDRGRRKYLRPEAQIQLSQERDQSTRLRSGGQALSWCTSKTTEKMLQERTGPRQYLTTSQLVHSISHNGRQNRADKSCRSIRRSDLTHPDRTLRQSNHRNCGCRPWRRKCKTKHIPIRVGIEMVELESESCCWAAA